jgi:hypothetical protein
LEKVALTGRLSVPQIKECSMAITEQLASEMIRNVWRVSQAHSVNAVSILYFGAKIRNGENEILILTKSGIICLQIFRSAPILERFPLARL